MSFRSRVVSIAICVEPIMVVSVDRFLSGGDRTGVVQPAVSWDRELIAYQLRDYKPNSNNDTGTCDRVESP